MRRTYGLPGEQYADVQLKGTIRTEYRMPEVVTRPLPRPSRSRSPSGRNVTFSGRSHVLTVALSPALSTTC